MKIRKHLYNNKEQKVYIYENKKEEYFVVAIPAYHWSIQFTYEKINLHELITSSLPKDLLSEEKELLSGRINQWTGEM